MLEPIRQAFATRYGRAPEVVARAPGRIEVLGNHTDYNEGWVISCAIDLGTWFAAAAAPGTRARIANAWDGSEREFDVAQLGPPTRGDWVNYVKGVVAEMQQRGARVGGFDACVMTTVPISAGMSSSAALEISAAYALGRLCGATFSPADWARIGQGSENHYVGAHTGLLDQFSSINGRANHLVVSDFRELTVQTAPVPPGAVFVVADSGVKHNLTLEYNERRESCERAAVFLARKYPGVRTLRDVSPEQLAAVRGELDDLTWRRAAHVVGEDDRVHRGLAALAATDLPALGRLLYESHDSSRVNFENSCPELDVLVELSRSLPGCWGARLSGGGFGGISIHLVAQAAAEDYRRRLATAYRTRTGKDTPTRICAIGAGAEVYV